MEHAPVGEESINLWQLRSAGNQSCRLAEAGTVMADGPTDELLHDQPLSTLFNTLLRVVRGGGYPTGASSPKTSLSGRHPVLLTEGFAPAPKETATFERVREEEIGRGCFC